MELEKRAGGRIGVTAVDTGTGRRIVHRGGERFAMCSTFKLLVAAAVLHRVDGGSENLSRIIPFDSSEILDYSPITKRHLAERGMNVGDLCAAAIQYSDNTAANLLLKAIGGPQGITSYVRTFGDTITHLDRSEPELNTLVPGKDLDSTTPNAMADTLQKLVLGTTLSSESRSRLEQWLLGNTTGNARLKAGLPAGWRIADKTGTGDGGATNDIGILYPPSGSPIIIAAYVADSQHPRAELESALAGVARIVVNEFTLHGLKE